MDASIDKNIIFVDASIITNKNNFYFHLFILFEFFLNAIKIILIHESIYTSKIKLYSAPKVIAKIFAGINELSYFEHFIFLMWTMWTNRLI